jgi:hypothetical protein
VERKSLTSNPNRSHDRLHFYKYMTAATAQAALRSRTLRWSSPLIFNDPFDTPRKLSFDCTARELQEALAAELATLIETGADIPSGAPILLSAMLSLIKLHKNQDIRSLLANDLRTEALRHIPAPATGFNALQEHWDSLIPTMRILCLSEVPHSTAMWAHYAESHRGVVIEFEASDSVDSPLLIARPIVYRDGPPRLPTKAEWVESLLGRKRIDLKEFFTDYQFVKSQDWASEKEWRVLSYARPGETGSHSQYPFSVEELSRVIVGSECSAADEAQIRQLTAANYPNAVVLRAVVNHTTRRIEF